MSGVCACAPSPGLAMGALSNARALELGAIALVALAALALWATSGGKRARR